MDAPTPGGRTARPRLIVADDHHMIAESLSSSLAGDYDIVGTVFNGDELTSLVSHQAADCLLLDLMMPGTNGLEIVAAVRKLQPGLKIVVVTVLEDRAMAHAALDAGASAFVPKTAGIDELRQAIAEVLGGREYVSPLVPHSSNRMGASAAHPALANLTPREHEVVLLLGQAKSETEIAKLLDVHISTVAYHMHHAMEKLGVGTHAALVKMAVLLLAGLDGMT